MTSLAHLDTILTLVTIIVGSVIGIRELVQERRNLRAPSPPVPEAATTLGSLPLDLAGLQVGEPDGGGIRKLTLSFDLKASSPATDEATAGDFPAGVTVVSITGQPFVVQQHPAERRLRLQTAGDENAGFYRLPAPARQGYPPGARVEAYRWGRLTAGVAIRVLWLLLLPFSLANVALWLCPPGRVRRYLVHLLCRLFALSLTVSTVLTFVAVSIDLGGWQCLYRGSCDAAVNAPEFLGDHLGRRLAVLALIPIALVAAVWYLARRTWHSYEAHPVPLPDLAGANLASPDFWHGRRTVRRLRAIHVTAAFATVNLVLVGALTTVARQRYDLPLAAGSAAALGLCALLLAVPPMMDDREGRRIPDHVVRVLRTAAIGLTVATLVWAYRFPQPAQADAIRATALPYLSAAVVWVFVVQLMLCLVMVLTAVTPRRRKPYAQGIGVPIFAILALGAAAASQAGLVYRAAGLLSAQPAGAQAVDAPLPAAPYQWAGLGFAVMVALAIGAAFFVVRPGWRQRRAAAQLTDAKFPGQRAFSPRNARRVDQAIASAGVADRMLKLLGWACVPLVVLAGASAVFAARGSYPPSYLGLEWLGLATIGPYLVGAVVFGLIVLILLAYRQPSVLNALGFLWEINTFWPRTCHPFAPPCYAARTVPELAVRITRLLRERDSARVVLVGHGQGSVLTVAALRQLSRAERGRVALVTAGSPLGRLYTEIFDEHFHAGVFADLADDLADPTGVPRWRNLWRATDPVSGAVPLTRPGEPDLGASAAVNQELDDPVSLEIAADEGRYPPVRGHGGYESDPRFAAAICELAHRL